MALKDRLPHERLALVGLACLLVGAGAYAIVKASRQPAPIVFEGLNTPATGLDPAPNPKQSAPTEEVIHVVGAVHRPGVFRLRIESRVEDAVAAAGGATSDAALDHINLAAKLVDGTQVFVPHKSKPDEFDSVAEPYRGVGDAIMKSPRSPGVVKHPPAGGVSLNSGTESELESLPGIGPATAQKILAYRKQHKRFKSIDELSAIGGMGAKKLRALRSYLRL